MKKLLSVLLILLTLCSLCLAEDAAPAVTDAPAPLVTVAPGLDPLAVDILGPWSMKYILSQGVLLPSTLTGQVLTYDFRQDGVCVVTTITTAETLVETFAWSMEGLVISILDADGTLLETFTLTDADTLTLEEGDIAVILVRDPITVEMAP